MQIETTEVKEDIVFTLVPDIANVVASWWRGDGIKIFNGTESYSKSKYIRL